MTRRHFTQLSLGTQQQLAFLHGTLLAQRWEAEDHVHLYHFDVDGPGWGFFVEVYHDLAQRRVAQVRTLTSTSSLQNYAASIELPIAQ